MIPKIIHFCWFGTKPIPKKDQEYIEGWKQLMPDYEIMLWNEQNSPMHLPYMQMAMHYKKWANLANFTRIYALYHHGGIYMDTDVEVLRSLDEFRQYSCFLGLELGDREGEELVVNNAIFGAEKKHPFVEKCINFYLENFDGRDTPLDSSPYLMTRILKEHGMRQYGRQNVGGVELFPKEYFYPYHVTEQFFPECVKENTYTIHHWSYSWAKRPFSYRLEHLKQLVKDKVYRTLPIHFEAQLRHGKLMRDLLREGTVKAGPFAGMKLPLARNIIKEGLPLKLAGLYKEELQFILYQLTNNDYRTIYFNGENNDYFLRGLSKLFPRANIEKLDYSHLKIKDLEENTLVVSNGLFAEGILENVDRIPKKADIILEFKYHLPEAEKKKFMDSASANFYIEWVPSEVNYNYEKNAFLINYSIKDIERYLKKPMTNVQEWMVLKAKNN